VSTSTYGSNIRGIRRDDTYSGRRTDDS